MTGCIRNWDKFFEQAYRFVLAHPLLSVSLLGIPTAAPFYPRANQHPSHTKPGGYIELQEMDYMGVIQPTSKNPGISFMTWCVKQGEAAGKVGLSLRTSSSLISSQLARVGYQDIQVHEFKLPIGPWPANKRLRDAGLLQLSAMLEGMEGLSLRLLKFYGGWTQDELRVLLAKVRTELRDKACHAYWPVYVSCSRPSHTSFRLTYVNSIVVYGRKPEAPAPAH